MAYITPIGSNPEQVEYRLGQGHGCGGPQGTDRQFSYHADGRERPLRWIGRGLTEVGITPGSVLDEAQFPAARALMDGRDPRTGETLVEAKRAVPDDAKVALAPLVRAVEEIAAEADVSTEEVLDGHGKTIERFERARRSVERSGEAARLRADHAGAIADAAGIDVEAVWGEQVYAEAAGNLFETVTVTADDGTVSEQRRPRRVIVGNAGYDVTFTLPKSLSVLLAFADETTAAAVEGIYTDGVERTFAWLEEATAYGMRGWHGDGHTAETVKGSGYLGWTMVHRAARPVDGAEAGDPHWHVHTTIANMTRGSDGKWSTVAAGGRDLMRHAPAVDHMLKALVRRELSQRLGVRFARNDRTGAWEIVGIPDETLQQFSKRHGDIDTMLEKLGYDPQQASRAQERIAEQRSRGKKSEATAAADATLQHLWQGEELAAGREPDEQMREVFRHHPGSGNASTPLSPDSGSPTDPAGGKVDATPSVAEIAAQLLEPEHGLTAHSRRFTRADTVARVADALPYGCASTDELDALTDAVLAEAGFLQLPGYGQQVEGPNGEREHLAAGHMANAATYTTQDVVDAETVILRAAKASHEHQLDTRVGEDVLELGTNIVEAQQPYPLDEEQHAALRRVVTTGYGVDTVTGRPGSGKTTLMRAVRTVYEAAGYVIGGAATAAVAAQNLETESGISSRTVASYVDAITKGKDPLRGVDVLVVDEANLTEDRDRAALYLQAAKHGTKVVEVGDGKQLRGVGLGSLFSRVHEIVGGPELRNNRRQAEEDERAAIDAWREGRYVEAFSIWHGNGRFHATESNEDTTAAMVARWWAARQGAPDAHTEMRGLAMLAATNAQVHRLNQAAQAVRLAEGELGQGRTYDVAGAERIRLHVGEHILVRVNDRAGQHTHGPPVLNGYRALIRDIDERGTITAEWQRDTADGLRTETAQLSARYVGIGGVELGYGMTIHKAEGLTVGGAHGQWHHSDGVHHGGRVLFHAPAADNPAAYVALSRHKQQVDIFGALEDLESEQQRYLLGQPRTRKEVADRAIERLSEHARTTEEHGDDRPVVADLGISEFLSETAADRQATTARESEDARLREERQAEHEARARRRAEREAERAERAETKQRRREWAAQLLREVWRHEPTLAEKIIAAAAFDTVARNLHDAGEAGYDVREVLADLPTSTIASPRVHDKARFAAWGIDHAAERLRTGQAQRDHERATARADWEQARDQAADLIEQAWSKRPELAEAVIHSGAFDAFVRTLDYYTTAGLDPDELLAQVSVDKLADPSIRDQGAFATYSLHRVGDRQLDEADEAHRRAEQRAEAEQQQRQAADALRQAWNHAPEAVERVITGPAFRLFTDQVTAAGHAGHDVDALLATLSPDVLTGPHVANPSGTVTFALKRAVERAQHPEPEPPSATAEPISQQTRDQMLRAAHQWATARPEPVQPAQDDPAPADPELDRLAAVNAAAARFYAQQLDDHPQALDYLRQRLPDADAARQTFTLGYAPDAWRGVTDHLRGKGYAEQDLLDAGVSKHNRRGELIDRFRDRVVLAVRDEHDRIAGFTGRPPHEPGPEVPKYLNTPATALYTKSEIVFGLVEQRHALAEGATPVLVEGPFDVVALSTAPGLEARVAPVAASGTAVTDQHLAALAHATGRRELVVGLDGDDAGQTAAARTARRALGSGLDDTRVVTLPDGHDPASWVAAHADAPQRTAAPYLEANQQQPAAEFLTDYAIDRYFAGRPAQHRDEVEGQLGAARAAVDTLAEVDMDTAVRTGLRIAERTGTETTTVMSMLGQRRTTARSDAPSLEARPAHPDAPDAEGEPHREPTPDESAIAEPTEFEIAHAEPVQLAPIEPAADSEPGADEQQSTPHWSAREFGSLDEQELAEQAADAQQRAQRSAAEREQAQQQAEAQRSAADAGNGPEVRAVDEHLQALREQATTAREADELENSWQATVDRAADAAEARVHAERERDQLGRLARSKRAALENRIAELTETETTAQAEAASLAERAAPLQQQVGTRQQRRQLAVRARAAEADAEHAREAAQRRDVDAAETADRHAARLADQQTESAQRAESLTAEQQLRTALPEPARAAEQAERTHTLQPAQAAIGQAQPEAGHAEAEPSPQPELDPAVGELEQIQPHELGDNEL